MHNASRRKNDIQESKLTWVILEEVDVAIVWSGTPSLVPELRPSKHKRALFFITIHVIIKRPPLERRKRVYVWSSRSDFW